MARLVGRPDAVQQVKFWALFGLFFEVDTKSLYYGKGRRGYEISSVTVHATKVWRKSLHMGACGIFVTSTRGAGGRLTSVSRTVIPFLHTGAEEGPLARAEMI